MQYGSHYWVDVELPLRMNGRERNSDIAHGTSLEIVPYDLYPCPFSDHACKTWHTNSHFISLRTTANCSHEHQRTALVTTTHISSPSDAQLKLYLLLLHFPAYEGTWGVVGQLKCSLLSEFGSGSCVGTTYPVSVGCLSLALNVSDTV